MARFVKYAAGLGEGKYSFEAAGGLFRLLWEVLDVGLGNVAKSIYNIASFLEK